MVTDPIADFLTAVRNAQAAKHRTVDVPSSKMKEAISQILVDQNFIRSFKRFEDGKQGILRVYLKYDEEGAPAIAGIRRASTPGRRRYVGKTEIPRVMNQLGISILTTPKGVITGGRARQLGVGGEILCYVW
ncbi:MAG: 30S ribosomal protein S8 [bacterium]|nr:30S ribosomal protein S8 [bacterium]